MPLWRGARHNQKRPACAGFHLPEPPRPSSGYVSAQTPRRSGLIILTH